MHLFVSVWSGWLVFRLQSWLSTCRLLTISESNKGEVLLLRSLLQLANCLIPCEDIADLE